LKANITIFFLLIHTLLFGDKQVKEKATIESNILPLLHKVDYYYSIQENEQGDSYYNRAVSESEKSGDGSAILQTIFYEGGEVNFAFCTKDRYDIMKSHIIKGIDYAMMYKDNKYLTIGYVQLSELNLTLDNLPEALKYAQLATSTALNTDNDSCKIYSLIQMGKSYLESKELLLSFKYFSNALDVAGKRDYKGLQSLIYQNIGKLYEQLNRTEDAKQYYFKSLAINKAIDNYRGIVNDKLYLGGLYDYDIGEKYITEGLVMAQKYNYWQAITMAQNYLFSLYIVNGDYQKALDYFYKTEAIYTRYNNLGAYYKNWIIGEIYFYGGQIDSAFAYFENAKLGIDNNYDSKVQKSFYLEYAQLLEQRGNLNASVQSYLKADALCNITHDIAATISSKDALQKLYGKMGDFKNAYIYTTALNNYKDTLANLTKGRDLAIMEIDNENKRIAEIKAKEESNRRTRHNLQYMGITMAIIVFFVLLIISGMFKVSTRAIEILGFFTFIFFFEFIILIADNKIHHLTHGEPLKIWIIKIVLISLLLPLHHYIEEEAIHYLTSKKILKMKERLSLKKLFRKKRHYTHHPKPVTPSDTINNHT